MTGWLVFIALSLSLAVVRFAWLAVIPYKPCSLCGFRGKRPKFGARMVRRAIGRPLP